MTYSKQDLINAGIPLDLTIDTIYHEYKRGGLSQLPRITMSNTIRTKYPSLVTVEDLFESPLNSKSVLEFEKGILAFGPTLCSIYDQNRILVLPSTLPVPLTLENGLRAFLPEFIAARKKRAKFLNQQTEAEEVYCKTIEMYFNETAVDNSRKYISSVLNRTRATIDNKIK